MSFGDWVEESTDRIENNGLRIGVRESAKMFWTGAVSHLGRRWNHGTHAYEKDWDVLVVLDTCRPDALEAVSEDYEYIPSDVKSINSIGSCSPEWIRKTFDTEVVSGEELAETAYVSANAFTEDYDLSALGLVDEVWKYGWDTDWKTIPPEVVTDRAISVMRNHEPERLVIHYMQPHEPYREFADENSDWFTGEESGARMKYCDDDWNMWDRFRHGEISHEKMWNAYMDNLHWGLEDGVSTLIQNIDADSLVITADHGEAFGEWGIYAHPEFSLAPVVKRVPWVEVEAEDTGEYTPTVEPEDIDMDDDTVNDRLEALGYK